MEDFVVSLEAQCHVCFMELVNVNRLENVCLPSSVQQIGDNSF